MSRPQKMHKPLKGGFNNILASVAMGKGTAKRAARKAMFERPSVKASEPKLPSNEKKNS